MAQASLPKGALNLAVPNSLQGLKMGLDTLGEWLTRAQLGQEVENRAFLVFEEIVTNIIRYGFDDSLAHEIKVAVLLKSAELTLTFDDDGRPFDPRCAPHPEPHRSLERAPIGGRGLLLVRKLTKHLDYERTPNGRNRLTVGVPLL
jgi:anti-sigma regulatory factor (Ser/Thr protein kinase)